MLFSWKGAAGNAYAPAAHPPYPWKPATEPGGIHRKIAASDKPLAATWLRNKDSNLDKQCQRLPCYHYTIPQYLGERYYYIEFTAFVKRVCQTNFALCEKEYA